MTNQRLLTGVAKRLRHEMTDAECVLWREVRAHRFAGFKFKRQEPLGSFVVDFVCYEAKLIVELDGGQHANQQEAECRADSLVGISWISRASILEQRRANEYRKRDAGNRKESPSPRPSPARREPPLPALSAKGRGR